MWIPWKPKSTTNGSRPWSCKASGAPDRIAPCTNLAILAAGTGLGIVSGLLQISKSTTTAGDAIGAAAGGISALFAIRAYRQVHGGKRPAWILPNMLAAFFGQPEEQHSHYPDDIWSYLNSAPSGAASAATRKDQLLAAWVAAGRTGPPDSSRFKNRVALLTSTNAADKHVNLELMNERAAMLADVGNQVSLMKRDLADLLHGLRPQWPCRSPSGARLGKSSRSPAHIFPNTVP